MKDWNIESHITGMDVTPAFPLAQPTPPQKEKVPRVIKK
jgi:hypothetical protein